MADNTSSHSASDYDAEIAKTIPHYGLFHAETLDFVGTAAPGPRRWLDTGCGTGSMAGKVLTAFEAMDELSQKARIDIPQGLKELRGLPERESDIVAPGEMEKEVKKILAID